MRSGTDLRTLRVGLTGLALALVVAVAPAGAATVTVRYALYPDWTDPAMSYTVAGWQILSQTHTPLLTYVRAEGPAGTQLMPGLAEAMPVISPDGKTYTFQLRAGLRYSDGQPVHAGDFEHAIKRVLRLDSGASVFYTSTIVGAKRYRARRRGGISGITARGRTITVRLLAANGQFPFIVAMPFASLVPSSTPFRYTHASAAGVGPLRFHSDDLRRGRLVLRRNPFFALPGIPPAVSDEIRVVERARRFDVEDDASFARPPHTRAVETVSTYYFFLNHRTPPFDRKEVRQAVNFGVDRRALSAAYGGWIRPGCTFLPPILAPERASEPCPYGDPNAAPQVERARRMIAAAGATGASVKVYGNTEPVTRAVTSAFVDSLNAIGLRARARIVRTRRYFQTIGRQRERAQSGFTNWFQDYPHPGNFLFLVDPDTIRRTNNQNFGNVDDPLIKSELDRLRRLPLADALPGYLALDRRVVDEAHVVPFGHFAIRLNFSSRVPPECFVFHPVFQIDFSRLCVT